MYLSIYLYIYIYLYLYICINTCISNLKMLISSTRPRLMTQRGGITAPTHRVRCAELGLNGEKSNRSPITILTKMQAPASSRLGFHPTSPTTSLGFLPYRVLYQKDVVGPPHNDHRDARSLNIRILGSASLRLLRAQPQGWLASTVFEKQILRATWAFAM